MEDKLTDNLLTKDGGILRLDELAAIVFAFLPIVFQMALPFASRGLAGELVA